MSWRYGIVKYYNKNNIPYYGIGELYYDQDPLLPYGCTKEPIETYLSDETNLTEDLVKKDFIEDLKFIIEDIKNYPIFDSNGPYLKSPWDKK